SRPQTAQSRKSPRAPTTKRSPAKSMRADAHGFIDPYGGTKFRSKINRVQAGGGGGKAVHRLKSAVLSSQQPPRHSSPERRRDAGSSEPARKLAADDEVLKLTE